jgi:hypothetical protein
MPPKDNQFQELAAALARTPAELRELGRLRLGGDLSYNFDRFSFESEFITAHVDDDIPELDVDLGFYYATLGYALAEDLLVYGSYWFVKADVALLVADVSLLNPGESETEKEDVSVPNAGISYNLTDGIRLKGHYARVRTSEYRRFTSQNRIEEEEDNFSVYSAAISVVF